MLTGNELAQQSFEAIADYRRRCNAAPGGLAMHPETRLIIICEFSDGTSRTRSPSWRLSASQETLWGLPIIVCPDITEDVIRAVPPVMMNLIQRGGITVSAFKQWFNTGALEPDVPSETLPPVRPPRITEDVPHTIHTLIGGRFIRFQPQESEE